MVLLEEVSIPGALGPEAKSEAVIWGLGVNHPLEPVQPLTLRRLHPGGYSQLLLPSIASAFKAGQRRGGEQPGDRMEKKCSPRGFPWPCSSPEHPWLVYITPNKGRGKWSGFYL